MLVFWSYLLSLVLHTTHPTDFPPHQEPVTFALEGLQFDNGLRIHWAEASPQCQLMALPLQAGESQRVLWQNVYPNADLTVITYLDTNVITYQWIIYPGGLVDDIVIESLLPYGRFRGGDIPEQVVQFAQPEAWQDQGGITDRSCEVWFVWRGNQLLLELGDYEPAQVIHVRWTQQQP